MTPSSTIRRARIAPRRWSGAVLAAALSLVAAPALAQQTPPHAGVETLALIHISEPTSPY